MKKNILHEINIIRGTKKSHSNTMQNSSRNEQEIIFINSTNLANQLRIDGIYYYNFQVYIYLLWILAFMIVLINGLCLIALEKSTVFSKQSDTLLKCMVICDLLMGTLSVPLWLISWLLAYHFYPNCVFYRFSVFSCKLVCWLNYLTITLITLERYISKCKPYFYVKWSINHHIYRTVLLLVFLSSMTAVSSKFLFGTFTLQVTILCFVILAVLIVNIMLYVKISQSITCINNYHTKLVGKQFATNKVTSLEKKGQLINLMMLLTLTFSYCPYFLLQMLHFFGALEDDLGYVLGIWGYAFVIIRSLVNPILYCISHIKFRQTCFQLLPTIFNISESQF